MTTTLGPRRPTARPRTPARPGAEPRARRTAPPLRAERTRTVARVKPLPPQRLIALLVVLVLLFGAIIARLVYIQGIDAGHYNAYGESQRVRNVVLPAARGSISDRNGFDLAISVPRPTVWANPRLVTDPHGEAATLSGILGQPVESLQQKLSGDGSFVYLARKTPEEVGKKIDELKLDGVFLLQEPTRVLPAGGLAASLIGQTGLDNDGQSGLERQFDTALAGRPGQLVVERDATGSDIPGGVRQFHPSLRGDDIELTIDRSLQYAAERALSDEIVTAHARGGMAIVMQTDTGDVLAMADLTREVKANGEFGDVQPAKRALALTDVFEPGSVNKMITIAGALDSGAIQATDHFTIGSEIKIANHLFTEHDPHPVQSWSVTDIVANSSNVGAITIAQKLGKQRLNNYLRSFGVGAKTGLAFPGESSGILADPSKWYSTDMATIPIGQGGVSVTAIQMLAAYNAVANGGLYVGPRLVRATIDGQGRRKTTPPSTTRRVISATAARQMTAMLDEVVRVGTGKAAAVNGYTVAGKTGTARKPLPGGTGYKAGAYLSSFAGFVPAEKPAFSIMVTLDEPTPIYGGLVAAPVFAELAGYALREFRVPPPPQVKPAAVPGTTEQRATPVGDGDAGTTTTLATVPRITP
jgi:cell division protein FtsI (penicillin-binding protein 3)